MSFIFTSVDFGILMVLIAPFGVTCAANAANMLEGFNGLGTGLGIIMTVTLIIISVLFGTDESLLLLFPLLGALIAFLYFNRYMLFLVSFSPSSRATTAAPQASPHTFTAVRHISNNLSTAKIIPMPSSGRFTALSTMTIVTRPALGIAAAPIDAKVAVSIMTNCCAKVNSMP